MTKFNIINALFIIGASAISCSKIDQPTSLCDLEANIGSYILTEDETTPRFTGNNISEENAKDLGLEFLKQNDYMVVERFIGFDTDKIQYSKRFSVNFGNKTIHFRGISAKAWGKPTNQKLIIIGGRPEQSVNINSLSNRSIKREIIYEKQPNGVLDPVGRRYTYPMNYSGECWVMVNGISVSDYEMLIGY